MRLMLAAALALSGLVVASDGPARAVPGVCPPICDAIPDSAWIAPTSIPLYSVYQWPGLAGLAVTAPAPRFEFEQLCDSPPVAGDARDYAVAARALVPNRDGHWHLRAQVIHWRGDTVTGGPTALAALETARVRLQNCQLTAPLTSPSITTSDVQRVAAVVSVPGQRVVHEYLLAEPNSSTVVELAMWASVPPRVDWPAVPDAEMFEAMAAPLCSGYLGSCR
ncbi:MAG TPA: ATPase [Mycobacterium sp.]|nr:ATPase [Mycobacterium sp.]